MAELLKLGSSVLFMKVGKHAQESLADIIARKSKEIDQAGFSLWGYGGSSCHPTSMVQPFAAAAAERGQQIHLVMEAMDSKHDADPLCSAEYSPDRDTWLQIPDAIEVRGSHFALAIRNLRMEEFTLALNQTRVALGRSEGKLGSRYIKGQCDKACLEVLEKPELVNESAQVDRAITLVADLVDPYAVFLRGQR